MSCPVVMHPDPANLSPRAKSRSRQSSPQVSREGTNQQSPRSINPLQNLESIGQILVEAVEEAMQREFSIMQHSMNTMMARIADKNIWFESQFSQVKALQLRVLDGLESFQVNRNKDQEGILRENTPIFGYSQAVSSSPHVGDSGDHFDGPVANEIKGMAPLEIPTSSAVDGTQKDKSKAPVDKLGNISSAIRPTEFSSASAPGKVRLLAEDMLKDFTAGIKQGLEQLAVKIAEGLEQLADSSSSSVTSDADFSSNVDRFSQPSVNDGLPQQTSFDDGLPRRTRGSSGDSRYSVTERAGEFIAGLNKNIDQHEHSSMHRVISRITVLKAHTEESHNRFLYRVVQSHSFAAVCMLVVVLNGAWVGYEVDNQHREHAWMQSVSLAFNIFFIVELAIRIAGLRSEFILGPDVLWNLLDVFCVLISIPDFFSDSLNVSVLRIIRLSKLSKTLRLMRVVQAFRSLKEILATVFFTLGSLFWSFVAIFFAAYVFAILLLQALYFDMETGVGLGTKTTDNFSSLSRSILTLFSFITSGQDWFDYALEMAANGEYVAEAVLMVWMFFALFGLVNVVIGVFCARATEAQESLHDLRMEKQLQTRDAKIADLIDLFHEIDTEDRGLIDWKQFHDFANSEQGRAICESHGLSLLALEPLWHVMVGHRDQDSFVDASSFVMAFMRLSNEHLNSDILLLSHAVKAVRHELKEVLHTGRNDIAKREITEEGTSI